ncbi:MAG: hypothetical protein PHY92_10670 [Alphaproteobacteria bacterium]|nr:hypothetical protein [Alphaproteobacteria bacterium]
MSKKHLFYSSTVCFGKEYRPTAVCNADTGIVFCVSRISDNPKILEGGRHEDYLGEVEETALIYFCKDGVEVDITPALLATLSDKQIENVAAAANAREWGWRPRSIHGYRKFTIPTMTSKYYSRDAGPGSVRKIAQIRKVEKGTQVVFISEENLTLAAKPEVAARKIGFSPGTGSDCRIG